MDGSRSLDLLKFKDRGEFDLTASSSTFDTDVKLNREFPLRPRDSLGLLESSPGAILGDSCGECCAVLGTEGVS